MDRLYVLEVTTDCKKFLVSIGAGNEKEARLQAMKILGEKLEIDDHESESLELKVLGRMQ